MTSEKRYEIICNLIRAFASERGDPTEFPDKVIADPAVWAKTGIPGYSEAAALLLDEQKQMDKKSTGATVAAAIQRFYKTAAKNPRENMRGAFKSGDRWAICDGYRFIRLNKKPESVPECVSDMDLDRVIPSYARTAEKIELPTVAEIKAHIATVKAKYGAKQKSKFALEAAPGWWCDPQYLLDMVQALPDGSAHAPEKYCSPLYYESEDGDALLMPVKPPKAEQEVS